MLLPALSKTSDQIIIKKLKELKDSENVTLAEIVLYLSELDERKLYRDLGYSSLFTYCTEGLGYSESAAYRRIQAARSLKADPKIYELIRDGKLSLCAIAEIAKVKEEENKRKLLEESLGRSKREVQRLAVKYQEPSKPKRETIRAKKVEVKSELDLFSLSSQDTPKAASETKEVFTISIEVDKEFMELLDQAKASLGHRTTSEVFKKALKTLVSKKDSTPKRAAQKPLIKKDANRNSRYISKSVRHQVLVRDNKQCTFISPDGKRCSEKHGLEFDHIFPTSAGGRSEINNLRLLCRSHNLHQAEKFFGKRKIRRYSEARRR